MAKRRFVQKHRKMATWFFGAALAAVYLFSESYWERVDVVSSIRRFIGALRMQTLGATTASTVRSTEPRRSMTAISRNFSARSTATTAHN